MTERKKGPDTSKNPTESVEQEKPESERPTLPVPKKEKNERRVSVEAMSLSKEFGMSLNDDSYFEHVDDNGVTGTFAVADGMGGYPGGDIASQTITDALRERAPSLDEIRRKREAGDAEATLASELEALRSAMVEADARLLKTRDESPPLLHKMGTTGTVVRLTKDADGAYYAMIGQVGDSRAYLLHPDGRLETLTLDAQPSLAAVRSIHDEQTALRVQDILDELLGRGQLELLEEAIKRKEPFPEDAGVTKEDIEFLTQHMGVGLIEYYFAYRSTVQGAFGHEPQMIMKMVPISPGSKIVLCTDAVSDGLLKREIRAILRGAYDELPYQGVREAASMWGDTPTQALAFAAKERGEETKPNNYHPRSKGADDTTVVTIDVPKR